jgi:hypothetical protein
VSGRSGPYILRLLGAIALLGVGAVHLEQFYAAHYRVVPVIGTLFVLNFVAAAALALVLVLPVERLLGDAGRAVVALAALGGISVAVTSAVFLLISENTLVFGFMEHGYRLPIVLSFVAEGLTVLFLGSYLAAVAAAPRRARARAPAPG